jgi:hypothetical protein
LHDGAIAKKKNGGAGKEHKSATSQSLAPEEAENVVRGKLNPSDNRQQDARNHFTFRFISYHN